MKKCLLILILLVLSTIHSYSDTDQAGFVISPGIKLGYTFGEKGGFTYGLETSFIVIHTETYLYMKGNSFLTGPKWAFGGLVFGIDWFRDIRKTNIGLEAGIFPFGLGVGTAIITENGKTDMGVNINAFCSPFLVPYYNYTIRFNNPDLHEVGGYIKIPLPVYAPHNFINFKS